MTSIKRFSIGSGYLCDFWKSYHFRFCFAPTKCSRTRFISSVFIVLDPWCVWSISFFILDFTLFYKDPFLMTVRKPIPFDSNLSNGIHFNFHSHLIGEIKLGYQLYTVTWATGQYTHLWWKIMNSCCSGWIRVTKCKISISNTWLVYGKRLTD